jgi:hypothetical protein
MVAIQMGKNYRDEFEQPMQGRRGVLDNEVPADLFLRC